MGLVGLNLILISALAPFVFDDVGAEILAELDNILSATVYYNTQASIPDWSNLR